ncbi:hypothetical protein GCM10010276_81120 [Streptomyces longisporus]|uniref:Uncharacterized protein n=1 Tax=Streptomyces longisporus TaxID=1948 RepID=A0ABP6AMQ0_STRLO
MLPKSVTSVSDAADAAVAEAPVSKSAPISGENAISKAASTPLPLPFLDFLDIDGVLSGIRHGRKSDGW